MSSPPDQSEVLPGTPPAQSVPAGEVVCSGDLHALKILGAPDESYSLGKVLDCVSYPKLSNYQPSKGKKQCLMLSLIAAMQDETIDHRFITMQVIDVIVIHILLAPPPEDKNDNEPALQFISQAEEDARADAREPIDLSKRAYVKCCRKLEPSSIEVVTVNGLTKSICVFDRDFYRWFDSAPIDDAMSYFGAIATILLRAHVTRNTREVRDAIYGLVQLWPTFSNRTRPLFAFSIKESALEKLCELIRCDETKFRSVLKMLIAYHHQQMDAKKDSLLTESYFRFMVEGPFAYHGLQTFRVVDKVMMEYQLDREVLKKSFARLFNDNSLSYQTRKYVKVQGHLNKANKYVVFKPYRNLFEPLLFKSIAVDKTKELMAVSAGLLGMREVLELELFKSDEYLKNLYAEGVKQGPALRSLRQTAFHSKRPDIEPHVYNLD